MKFQVILANLPFLLKGAGSTIAISLVGILLGQVIGALVCVGRLSGNRLIDAIGALYVSFFRGVPLLIQLLLIYYMLPLIGIDVPALMAAIGALGLASGAYVSEIYRGSLNAIPRGQGEAALALGFSGGSIWRRILLPQAFRLSVPALVNELILLLKASSLISVIGVAELTRVSQTVSASTYRALEIYMAAGVIYFLINGCLAILGALVERHLRLQGRG
ncbi:amino acid ABC transporter permease [Rhodospirillum rubrum]|uniref:Amino acid ABC transporter, permease protein, 3-TM region, His/Glu/Gln/Arg/opine n=1 Tax=Rhodospirillum rubrum (strain ATCC 11170 / ATH 1.1.1 / DSM 467 / LMG 4362 / NCIMB 8255 / S1) TaxID=269796 RepID=Q2RUU8_RHORT|nr:amino acid ABC transporter permease [Rhodospirillum rubrum]ABC22097.1 Amino acid ABC transporter, permease protein, 3-TM region, His/Glu/Gln/Arg/opine [Rhodospirillum rubrum ATCC 11170]AEO47811.1 amino acid ABC transporter permease [Rhodospirillum rubrum F11]MBK5953687.1 amino acid ABC transporter permease [Rhodospirillum rubrum]QXG81749.1 amino acid ABC transporter permease [Rhodospirillum rubrum]HAQ00351.1 amino acid ABC transporter permease [Rhodospirillum rubrum]